MVYRVVHWVVHRVVHGVEHGVLHGVSDPQFGPRDFHARDHPCSFCLTIPERKGKLLVVCPWDGLRGSPWCSH